MLAGVAADLQSAEVIFDSEGKFAMATETDNRLDALLARAAKAQELAATIGRLREADPFQPNTTARLIRDGSHIIDEQMLKQIIAAGRRAMMEELENQLAELLEGA